MKRTCPHLDSYHDAAFLELTQPKEGLADSCFIIDKSVPSILGRKGTDLLLITC
ncbi:hypothetical protein [Marivirga lumbricoides]|uniref:hypothetical protein n=1 Tax=Marivirga lumbricoides TaxID=1046115 RepID=UPI001662A485